MQLNTKNRRKTCAERIGVLFLSQWVLEKILDKRIPTKIFSHKFITQTSAQTTHGKGIGSTGEIEKPGELLSVPVMEAHIYYYYCSRKIINTIFLRLDNKYDEYTILIAAVRCTLRGIYIYISIRESRFYASFDFWGFNERVRVFCTKAF